MITYDLPNKTYQVPLVVPTTSGWIFSAHTIDQNTYSNKVFKVSAFGWIFSAHTIDQNTYSNKVFKVSAFSSPSIIEHEGIQIGPLHQNRIDSHDYVCSFMMGRQGAPIIFFTRDGEISTNSTNGLLLEKKKHPFSVNIKKDLRIPEKIDNKWTAGDSTRIVIDNLESQDNLTLNVPGIGIAVSLSLDYTSILVIAMKKIHILDNPFFT